MGKRRKDPKTKAEREWLAWLHTQPCICAGKGHPCWGEMQAQHITVGGRRLGDFFSFAQCKGHHHWDSPLPIGHCFGKGSKPFAKNYGTQMELLEKQRERWFRQFNTKPWENEDALTA